MALNLAVSAQHIPCSTNHVIISSTEASTVSPISKTVAGSTTRLKLSVRTGYRSRAYSYDSALKCSLDTVGPTATVGQVTEVNKDTFWPIVEAAGDKTVVLDMFTQWCGPCKVIAPRFQELSEKYLDVVFLKLDCNKENKDLAKELGIRVVPTFKILKDSKIVKEVTGAKFDDLVLAIESVRSN